jgi:hypothetical protein
MKLREREDQVPPAKASASDTAISCDGAAGATLTCRL